MQKKYLVLGLVFSFVFLGAKGVTAETVSVGGTAAPDYAGPTKENTKYAPVKALITPMMGLELRLKYAVEQKLITPEEAATTLTVMKKLMANNKMPMMENRPTDQYPTSDEQGTSGKYPMMPPTGMTPEMKAKMEQYQQQYQPNQMTPQQQQMMQQYQQGQQNQGNYQPPTSGGNYQPPMPPPPPPSAPHAYNSDYSSSLLGNIWNAMKGLFGSSQ